jgi:hypothetical protein
MTERKKVDRKASARHKQQLMKQLVRMEEIRRQRQKEKTVRKSPKYKATTNELERLAVKAIGISKRQKAELMATFTTWDQRVLLESLLHCWKMREWLMATRDLLETDLSYIDSPDFKQVLLDCSAILSQHEDKSD